MEVKTEPKAEPMVKMKFLGEAYSGREIKRAVRGKSYPIPKSAADKLIHSFPGEWEIVEDKAGEIVPVAEGKIKKIIEPEKPKPQPAMTKANSFQPPEKKLEVKPEVKKEEVVQPKPQPAPVTPPKKETAEPPKPAPKKPLPPAPKLSTDGKKVTRRKQK